MCTPKGQSRIWAIGLLLLLTLVTGCNKKCQQPAEAIPTSFTATDGGVDQWRVAPGSQIGTLEVDNYNFLIFQFSTDFTGAVYEVNNNSQNETPSLTFVYDVDPDFNELLIEFQPVNGEPVASTYKYDLGREFELVEQGGSGTYLRMIPFQGIVDPDKSCTF